MYFSDRVEAGKQLAERLLMYRDKQTVVLALNETSAIVAAQVAMKLHANMVLYMIKDIRFPNEEDVLAGMSSTGDFHYNSLLNAGEVEELASEYHGWLDEQRMQKNHELNVLLSDGGTIKKDMLRHHIVIVVADGVISTFALDMVANFLKTIAIKRFVIATPIANVEAVDRMRVLSDELHCLGVHANLVDINHYYDKNSEITVPEVLKIIRNISLSWEQQDSPPPQPIEQPVVREIKQPEPVEPPEPPDDEVVLHIKH